MASHAELPIVDLAAGRQVLKEHLPRVLSFKNQTLEELGWRLHSDRTLLVPMRGSHAGREEDYLLRLDFMTRSEWPPSARFVNPETLDYELHVDQHHLPMLTSPEVHVHTAYDCPGGRKIQLICCSAVLQYYDVLHGGEDNILWRGGDTFLRTLTAIERAFLSHYSGRFAPHAG